MGNVSDVVGATWNYTQTFVAIVLYFIMGGIISVLKLDGPAKTVILTQSLLTVRTHLSNGLRFNIWNMPL